MMKERFAKLLLGEDMSGSGKGVCTALAISNAVTNLCGTIRLATIPSCSCCLPICVQSALSVCSLHWTKSLFHLQFLHLLSTRYIIGRNPHFDPTLCCVRSFHSLDDIELPELWSFPYRSLFRSQRRYSGSSGGWSRCCRR
jgi:hypothetical protein